MIYNETALCAGNRLGISQGSAAGSAASLSDRIGRATVFAGDPAQPFRELLCRAQGTRRGIQYFPDIFDKL
jgi:hypothetical protein